MLIGVKYSVIEFMMNWSLPLSLSLGAVLFAFSLSSCQSPEKGAVKELTNEGYALNEDSFRKALGAGDLPALKKFKIANYDLSTLDSQGRSALHIAAAAGQDELVKWLLGEGLAIDLPDQDLRTPLMIAALADQPSAVRELLRQGADPMLRDKSEYRALLLAAKEGALLAIPELAYSSREDLDNALFIAAINGNAEMVESLCSYGASVFARMDDGRTPLMLAAQEGHLSAIEALTRNGANRYAIGPEGLTAAELAEAEEHGEVVSFLNQAPKADEMSFSTMEDELHASVAEEIPSKGAPQKKQRITDQVLKVAVKPTSQANPSQKALRMTGYHEKALPLIIEKVEGSKAVVKLLYGQRKRVSVAAGETLPQTQLRVKALRKRSSYSKENQEKPGDLSIVEVEDLSNGVVREFQVNKTVSAHEPYAILEGESPMVAKLGDRFKGADGNQYIVVDIRPNQVVIENQETGEPVTLNRRAY